MDARVKQEIIEALASPSRKRGGNGKPPRETVSFIDLSTSSDSEENDPEELEDGSGNGAGGGATRAAGPATKKRKMTGAATSETEEEVGVLLLERFLPPEEELIRPLEATPSRTNSTVAVAAAGASPRKVGAVVAAVGGSCKQFWKAGDYEGAPGGDWEVSSGGMDHVRVHPKFLHSNATSHKWALGAFAELLDNSLDEVCNGATYVSIDMLENRKDGGRMLLIEDNGGGMDPEKMRHCMSLGYSAKSKVANTIGQYGNGFKTSTMRLGADVIVFSRSRGKDGKSPTQSIGLLSYTFLRSTGKEDIVVPMLDYERRGPDWSKLIRSSLGDWNINVETIVQWSPFSSEEDLLRQFNLMKEQGTRIIIFNLWEDDQGLLELDFDADPHDIQLRGVNRDEKNIKMATQYPNSRHFLTYKHSLRSYSSILYLRIPPGFRIILRGKDVEHHNIVNDMMQTEQVTYRPQYGTDGVLKDSNMSAVVTIGFVKDAKHHVDVQGFNVYHKNRLIKPFWRIWNAAGSDGRGVIGLLEANFVEPAHDKQGFERTTVLSRLEARLVQMQKNYWKNNCHKIGYARRRNIKQINGSSDRETSSDNDTEGSARSKKKTPVSVSDKLYSSLYGKHGKKLSERTSKTVASGYGDGLGSSKVSKLGKSLQKTGRKGSSSGPASRMVEHISDDEDDDSDDAGADDDRGLNGGYQKRAEHSKLGSNSLSPDMLEQENRQLRERLKKKEAEILQQLEEELQHEKDRRQTLETELEAANRKIDQLNKEQESLIDIFSEERERRDREEENLRKKLKEASNSIQELLEKIKQLESMKTRNGRR